VAAAGNSNRDVSDPASPFFPANNPHAITVSAFDHADSKAFFSNYGPKIDVAAPGGGEDGSGFDPFRSVLSLRSSGANADMTGDGKLVVGSNYLRQAGTSMAAPHVAGAAALILSAHPGYSPAQVRQSLRAGADDVDAPGHDVNSGYGRINVGRSVNINALASQITSPASRELVSGDNLTIAGSASGPGFDSYKLEYGSGASPSSWTQIGSSSTAPVTNGQLADWDIVNVPDGDYTLRLTARNSDGVAFTDIVAIKLDHVVLSAPASNTIIRPGGPIEISGSAGGGGFQEYKVEWRVANPDYSTGAWQTAGISLAGGGNAKVNGGLLATLDDAQITRNTDVDFRLTVTRSSGNGSEQMRHVVIDPTLRAGWPQKIAGLPDFNTRLMHHMTIADLDNDGSKEILAAYGDLVYAFRADGSLVPGWPRQLNGGTAATPFTRSSPSAADLDGDGKLEVVASDTDPPYTWSADGDTYIWHDDGTPLAGWPKNIFQRLGRASDTNAPKGGPRGDFVLTDINDDGRRDIVAVVGPAIVAMDRDGNMLPGWPQRYPLDHPCVLSDKCFEDLIAIGDVNGDGKKEIAAVTADLSKANELGQILLLYSHDGRVMPGFPKKITNIRYGQVNGRHTGYINAPTMADVNGDGDLEIVATTDKMQLKAFDYTGHTVKLKPAKARGTNNDACLGAAIPPILEPMTAADLNGDGRAELLASSHTKEWRWHSTGTRTTWIFCPAQTRGPDFISTFGTGYLPGWPVSINYLRGDNAYGPGSVAVGDINGDGVQDVVSGSGICGYWDSSLGSAGHRCFTINAYDARGNPLEGFPKATPGPGTTAGVTPAIGDLDGDGHQEIVWIDFYGNLLVWEVPGASSAESTQWPMFRHDPGHTGALVTNP
jgi:hypothetical protein